MKGSQLEEAKVERRRGGEAYIKYIEYTLPVSLRTLLDMDRLVWFLLLNIRERLLEKKVLKTKCRPLGRNRSSQ